jgi:hypothetical protein
VITKSKRQYYIILFYFDIKPNTSLIRHGIGVMQPYPPFPVHQAVGPTIPSPYSIRPSSHAVSSHHGTSTGGPHFSFEDQSTVHSQSPKPYDPRHHAAPRRRRRRLTPRRRGPAPRRVWGTAASLLPATVKRRLQRRGN